MLKIFPRPLRRLILIVIDAWNLGSQRHLGLIAAGVAFFSILAVFPALAAVVAVWGLFADPQVVAMNMSEVAEFLPSDAFDLLNAQVQGLVSGGATQMGWATVISMGAALWSARAGMAALVQGLNAVFGHEVRGGIDHQIVSILLTLSMVGTVIVALAAGIVMPIVLELVPLGALEGRLTWLARLIAPAATILGVGIVYRYGANPTERGRPPLLSVGLFVAVALWLAVSELFAIYLTNFGTYNKVYGSIGAVIALLMWLYISAWAVLMGAALNAALEGRHKAKPASAI